MTLFLFETIPGMPRRQFAENFSAFLCRVLREGAFLPFSVAFLHKMARAGNRTLFYREGGFPVEQVDECLFFGPERAVVVVDQHVPHDLTLGGAFFEHQMELVQRPLGHGGGPHIS